VTSVIGISWLFVWPHPEEVLLFCTKFNLTEVLPFSFSMKAVAAVWVFNGTLRKEVRNAEWFHTTRQAQVAINVWLRQYNRIRPHHALNMRTPIPETLLEKPKISGQI
jgi:hypothetical protein